MIIKDKKDSIEKVKELGLNFFPQEVFSVQDKEGIENFVKQNIAEEYILRSVDKANGFFVYVNTIDEIFENLKNFNQDVTIAVSYRPFKDSLLLVGDIKVTRSFSGDIVDITARDDQEATQRNIYENPKYNMHISLDEDKVWKIPGFSKLMSYISDHQLYNVIVEFLVYDCKVGVKKENVVVTELRTTY